MALYVPPGARRDFALARAYLTRDPDEKRIFARVENSKRHFVLQINHRGDDRFDPNSNRIDWDPYSALRTTHGGRQSPALGLGHELDHACEAPGRESALSNRALPRYDTQEERRVIRGSERHAAETLGESVRFDHRGACYRVPTPVSR